MKRGKGAGEGTGLEGKKRGRMREEGWEERGLKAHSKNSDFGTPMIYASCGPIVWPSLGSAERAPTIKAIRGAVAIKGIFGN